MPSLATPSPSGPAHQSGADPEDSSAILSSQMVQLKAKVNRQSLERFLQLKPEYVPHPEDLKHLERQSPGTFVSVRLLLKEDPGSDMTANLNLDGHPGSPNVNPKAPSKSARRRARARRKMTPAARGKSKGSTEESAKSSQLQPPPKPRKKDPEVSLGPRSSRGSLNRGQYIDDWSSYYVNAKSRKPALGLSNPSWDTSESPEDLEGYMHHHCYPDQPCRCRRELVTHVSSKSKAETPDRPLPSTSTSSTPRQVSGQPELITLEIDPEQYPSDEDFEPGEKERVIAAVQASMFRRQQPNGKWRWYAFDGRPLNAAGLPTFTEEEKEKFKDPNFDWTQVPDITRDAWGRKYADYPTNPNDFDWLYDVPAY